MGDVFTLRAAIERRITVARLVLSLFPLVALWLEPSEPQEYARFAVALLGVYVLYAIITAGIAWASEAPIGQAWLIHSGDVLVLSVMLAAIDRPLYPLLPLLVYAFLSGSLRWQWRGTLWTGVALLIVCIAVGLHRVVVNPATFDPNVVVLRSAALVVIAILTGRLGALEARTRRQMRQLATPPGALATNTDAFVGPMLAWAGGITGAPRVLLVWEEPEEPWVELALWDGNELRRSRERPDAVDALVAPELREADFLHQRPASSVVASGGEFRSWNGEPLADAFRARFSIGPLFAVRLTGEELSGRLFFLDKERMTSDDLVLGGIIAHQLASRLRELHLVRRLEGTALLEERLRLARNLHDGTFQSLTGLALEMERLLRMPDLAPADARDSLREIQLSLQDEQQTLRLLIRGLRTSDTAVWTDGVHLETHIKDLVSRVERQRNLKVEVQTTRLAAIPIHRWADICLIVHEALVNVSRHARASSCQLEVGLHEQQVTVVVADNGQGFPFKGRYDHDTLTALGIGPSTLRERTILLGGSVTIESTDAGSRIEIRFPSELRAR